jgi:hypothetical protein
VAGGEGEPCFQLRVQEREGRRRVVVLGDLDLEGGARVVREGAPPVDILAGGQPRRLIALTGLEGPLVVHPDERAWPGPPAGG